MSGFNATQVQARQHEQFIERFSVSFGGADLKFAAKVALHVRDSCECFLFDRCRLANVVVKSFNQDASALVPHRIDKMGEADNRIRHPVAVVAIVQSFDWTINGELEVDGTARPEDQLHPAALVYGSIAKDPRI